MAITPQPRILDIKLYQGGQSSLPGQFDVLKLSSNENPFGPSPAVGDMFRQTAGHLHLYPSTDHADLRHAIGAAHDLPAEQVICGVGSDEIISLLCYAYAGPGDDVLYTEHGFGMYKISALAAGANPVVVPEINRVTDVDALIAAAGSNTKIVFIANPNNPTGTMIEAVELARLADGLPDHALLVLDGAYAEYVPGYDGGRAIIDQRENVVMTRTFSKIYGLGGMRVGWGYGPQAIIDTLNRLRGPFNLSQPALVAAEAAVRDQAYVDRCRSENTRLRAWLADALSRVGIPSDPSFANFILAQFETEETAMACDAHFKAHGVIVRPVASYGLPNFLRITVGDEPGCKKVAELAASFMENQKEGAA